MLNEHLPKGLGGSKTEAAGRQGAHCEVAVSATGYKRAKKTTTIDEEDTVQMHHLKKIWS